MRTRISGSIFLLFVAFTATAQANIYCPGKNSKIEVYNCAYKYNDDGTAATYCDYMPQAEHFPKKLIILENHTGYKGTLTFDHVLHIIANNSTNGIHCNYKGNGKLAFIVQSRLESVRSGHFNDWLLQFPGYDSRRWICHSSAKNCPMAFKR